MIKICARKKCQKEFEQNKPFQIYCSTTCRVYATRDDKPKGKIGRPKKGATKTNSDNTATNEENTGKPKTYSQILLMASKGATKEELDLAVKGLRLAPNQLLAIYSKMKK